MPATQAAVHEFDIPYPVVVVFRVWRDTGGVFALFPYDVADSRGHCTAYEHVGQHGAADYVGCIERSRPATEQEYARLRRELEDLGYVLTIRRRT